MCLPDFIEFKQIEESNPITGYRGWKLKFGGLELRSINQDYIWKAIEGPHVVLDKDSGLYSYNYNYKYYRYYNNYNYKYCDIFGIIKQWGKVAVHKTGYRSEYAKIDTLFKIQESNAIGPKEFINRIGEFHKLIEKVADIYGCKVNLIPRL
jgi:hypothetical protein